MSVKGEIIVEGAKIYCSSAQTFKNKGASVPLNVKSQQKKLGKNKYFAQEKPIATTQDTKAESINNGEGFVMCQDPKNTQTGYSPCKSKCKIEYKDYYENVDFDKGMKALIDKTTGICQGYGVPGTIQFATSGQTTAVSAIDVKNTDEFQIQNISSQWETAPVSKENAVNSITITVPVAEKPQGKYYFIKELAPVNASYYQLPTSFTNTNTILKLKVDDYKGDANKITWALFKGSDTKDKVKSFVGIGANISLKLDKLFENLPEGDYRIEAYMNKAGDKKCAIVIEYIIDQMESLTVTNKTLLKNSPIQVTAKFKTATIDFKKVLNPNYNTATRPVPIAYWKIKQKDIVLVNTATAIDTSLVRLDLIKTIAINEVIGIINFKNAGEYTLQAYTYIGDQSPLTANFTVVDSLSINTVKAESNALLRYNDTLKVSVDKYNVDNIFDGGTRTMQWYLQKDGVQLSLFEQSAVSKKSAINKRIDQIVYNDAQAGNNYFGKYAIEAYGKVLEYPKKPTFKGADTYFFEVIKNCIDSLVLPPKVPKGAIVNYETTARIMPLITGEAFQIEVPQGVTKNNDGSLMFCEAGEYEITAQLTGAYTDNKKITQKIKVADPVLKEALWAYGTGYKRTQTGYKEETHAFVEIAGLENQTITIKVWLRGDGDSFYLQPDKYMLEEKKVTLNDKGKGSFMITTSDKYKEKIEKAIPPTVAVPNPSYRLVFTVELPTGKQGAVTLPADTNLENGKPIKGANLYEVLDANEELELTSEKLIKSIVFSTEDGKDVQQGITFYGKTHKIWVHTVNMIDDELKVEVFKEVPIDNLTETQNIIYTHESKETYPSEKVGSDGLLELSFTPKEEWNITCKNIDYYVASVSMKVKDEQNCDVWKVMSTQVRTNDSFPVSLEYDKEREKMGIKAIKEDGTPFTKEEMETLRGKFIQYIQGALKVSPYSEIAPEVKQGAPLVVEMGEIEKKKIKNCYCDKDLTIADLKSIVKKVTGEELIWKGIANPCPIEDKTFESLTYQLNSVFRTYDINKCIQKISFLAQITGETGLFKQSIEELSNHNSSKSFYKGRGLLQITGDADDSGLYNLPGAYSTYASKVVNNNIVTNPDLVGKNLHYAVDVAGWIWSINKKCPNWKVSSENEAIRWKAEYFKEGLGKSLNEIALAMEIDELKYFYLQAKILNGYSKNHKLERNPNGWSERKEALSKLKSWFKYDKNVCKDFVNLTFNAKDIVTYKIYTDGRIEKHIPKIIKEELKNKYKYLYIDEDDKEFNICIVDWHTTKEKSVGVKKGAKPSHSEVISDQNVSEGNTSRRVIYKNGDVAEYGSHPTEGNIWRLYSAGTNDIELVRMPDSLNDDTLKINYTFTNTQRRYTSPGHLAGFIGALAESKLKIVTAGSCFQWGSAFPSYDHSNGKSIDTQYLSDADEQKFINALVKFNFNIHLRGKNKKHFDHTTDGGVLHDSHLHSSFDESTINIINE